MKSPLQSLNKLSAVAERDIDLLLLEELNASEDFSNWLRNQVTCEDAQTQCLGGWHSVTDAVLGESDIIALYDDGFAILIENKIDAIAQPEQGSRYTDRGAKGIVSGYWNRFATCMVAPQRYLDREKDSRTYGRILAYEEIANYFETRERSKRSAYKAFIMREAIDQNRRGYSAIPDEDVTTFWLGYWKLVSELGGQLEMPSPGPKPAGSDWPMFKPKCFPPRFSIVHKWAQGMVDLQIADYAHRLDQLKEQIEALGFEASTAGKSAAVRIRVHALDRFALFEPQRESAIEGIRAALALSEAVPKISLPEEPT